MLSGLGELTSLVSDHERTLATHSTLSSNPATLSSTQQQLSSLQSSVSSLQPRMEQLHTDVMSVKQAIARSRAGSARAHPDIQRLEKETDDLVSRWEHLNIQVNDRYGIDRLY